MTSAVSSARSLAAHDVAHVEHATPSIAELASLAIASTTTTHDAPPELLRLGPELPAITAGSAARIDAPAMSLLGDVARIGSHLGPLERAVHALAREQGSGDQGVSERLGRLRVLVDCASALADLRVDVHACLRTARAA